MSRLEDAVDFFANASGRLKVKNNKQLQDALETIEHRATTRGLGPDHITTLIDVAASGVQAELVSKRLVKALIPSGVVPDQAILICAGWMCTKKPSITMQCLLVRWILVVYDYIDKKDRIHALYGVFFPFLHYSKMMPYVCHLLYLLTRKEDIKLFWVRMLLQYQKEMGPKPYLVGLLSIYRHYYPSLVHVVLPRTFKNLFPTYDRKWIAQIRQVREQNGLPGEVNMDWNRAYAERLHPAGKELDLVPSRKRRKIDPIPVIHSLVTKTSYKKDRLRNGLGRNTLPFAQIDTIKLLLDHIDQVEFPSQMGAMLRSDILQHLLSYTKDHVAAARFQFWLGETLVEELVHNQDKPDYKSRVDRLLSLLEKLTDFLQESIPAVDAVLLEYLPTWNGVDFRYLILKLVTRIRFYPFDVLCPGILEPLRQKFLMASVYRKCQILICLTDLLRNFAANEWPRHLEVSSLNSCLSLFCGRDQEFDGVSCISQYIQFVSRMVLLGMVQEKNNSLYEYCVIDFLELVSSIHHRYGLPFVVLRETLLYERLLVSPNPLTVSAVCALMCQLRMNLLSLKQLQRSADIDVGSWSSHETVNTFNKLVIEYSNCLWRGKAFKTEDRKSVFNFDASLADKHLSNDCLLVCHNKSFHGYLMEFLRTVPDQEQPSRDWNTIKDSKRDFLHYLSARGLTGVARFVSTFIRRESLNTISSNVSQLSRITVMQERSQNY